MHLCIWLQQKNTRGNKGTETLYFKTFRVKYFYFVSSSCNTSPYVSPWFFSKSHSNKQKLLRRLTTWKHRYTALLLPCYMSFYLRMLTNSWCMGICRRLRSLGGGRVIERCRERHQSPWWQYAICLLFDLCLSNAHTSASCDFRFNNICSPNMCTSIVSSRSPLKKD